MENKVAKYKKIALDIAYSIYNGDLKEGIKVKGRSTLAGKYNVSPETIRRAVKLLSDIGVVEVSEKSGIHVKSRERAHFFIQTFKTENNIEKLKKEIEVLFREKNQIDNKILENVGSIIEYSTRLRNVGSIYPIEIQVESSSSIVGETIASSRFWQNTGATIIGIKRCGNLYLSPGPDFKFQVDDIVLFVGNSGDALDKVKGYMEKG